jgi:hypothetical protein
MTQPDVRPPDDPDMALAGKVADAVLYEGYLLYPYRASAQKNRVRWQFGVLTPPQWAANDTGERAAAYAECLLEPGDGATLRVLLRCLQLQTRAVQDAEGTPVESLDVEGETLLSWDEAVEQEVYADFPVVAGTHEAAVALPAGREAEPVHTADGALAGWVVRQRWAVSGAIEVTVEPLPGPYGVVVLRLALRNTSDAETDAGRDVALRHGLLSAHLLAAVDAGSFVSLRDPPQWAKPAAEACRNDGLWTVLVGDEDRRRVVLASPIILDDFPTIAPESPGDLFDATEIDEILLLRTMTLTDSEKREARATDPRAAAIIDRADSMPQEVLDRLHGAIRYLRGPGGPQGAPAHEEPPVFTTPDTPWWDPGSDASVSPDTDSVMIGRTPVARGDRVRLRPGKRRADVQDMFLAGRVATVQAVLSDVDGVTHLAVTVDDDPNADIMDATGRYLYFAPDEVEPVVRT